ncbi:MAG: hypothetical protein A2Y33_06690 [Spirochaetes bacterium GWF1_51_8]|nr:MAG: hypothetical protein A2Y33_06690 [Spirochaetes bacterium GWF1_51_8]
MKHIDIFIHFLCLLSGIVTALLGFLLYFKYRIKAIRDYALFIFSTTLTVLATTLLNYLTYFITMNPVPAFQTGGTILFGLLITFINHAFTMFALGITNKKLSLPRKLMLALPWTVGAGAVVSAIVYYLSNPAAAHPKFIEIMAASQIFMLFAAFVIYSILISINLKKIENPDLKKALKALAVVFIVYIPLQTAMIILKPDMLYVMMSRNLFYIAINLVSVIYAAKYFFIKAPLVSERIEIAESFTAKYGITAREKDVIGLLLGGYAIKQIASELDCSFKTVNNHIYNVYRKTGVTSKMELLNCVKESRI